MRQIFRKFLRADDGAVTVDWVVLTAAVVGLAATGSGAILTATKTLSGNIETEVASKTVENGD